MSWAAERARFPVFDRFAYLNAGTFGPLARATLDAAAEEDRRAGEEGRGGTPYFERMRETRDRVRIALAAEIGVEPAALALTTSTTEGCSTVVRGLDLRPDDQVVTTDVEHFGLIGPLVASGARIRVARIRDRPPAEAFDAIRAEVTPRTRLLALSHVVWITGHRLPAAELRDATGLPVLVDGAQSAGAIPVDANAFDYFTVSAQKWLCGPDLTGALYVRDPDALGLALPSYLSQRDYDLAAATFAPREGADRFDTHFTPLAATAGLLAAFDLHPEWGHERAAETAARCRELIADGFDVVTEPRHSTLVSFRVDEPEETVSRLAERRVVVRDLPGTGLVRVSCGWWTSDDDLDRLVAAL